MPEWLRDLRSVLEDELALTGPLLPLGGGPPRRIRENAAEATAGDGARPEAVEIPAAEPAAAEPPAAEEVAAAPLAVESHAQEPGADDTDDMANVDLFGQELDPSEDPSLSPWERIEALIPEDSPLREMTTLDEVEAYARTHELIPLDATRTNLVFGVGDPEADLMVVGEAPGADEDRKGEPFVGRAGQLLNNILEAVHFQREEVYIANILKSRPPNNRDPLPEEVEAHIPLLYKQIALIRPKILLCVGKTAGNALLNRRSSLSSLRDRVHDYHGLPVVVTYHPAALLRNPQWKRPTWEDVKLLRTKYDELVKPG